MKRLVWGGIGLLLSGGAISGAVATEVDISVGTELFAWEEFDDAGNSLLEESGLRHFVSIHGTNHFDYLWSSIFSGRFYSGVVDYDGQTQGGAPVKTDVDYNGMRFELGLSRRIGAVAELRGESQWWVDYRIGADYWRRGLRDSQLEDGTVASGYTERYETIYGRVGARYSGANGFGAKLGMKWPFSTDEEVRINGQTISLNPEGRLSAYASLSYGFNPGWGVSLNYDSYRFAKSDPVVVGDWLVWQPESHQDTLGLAAHYRF